MGWFTSKKPVYGEWVEDESEMTTSQGFPIGLGTYHWEGPEPPDGRPENPGETPEGIAEREEIQRNMAKEKKKAAIRAQQNQQYAAKMKAKRGMAGGRRNTRKNRKRSQKRRKSCRR